MILPERKPATRTQLTHLCGDGSETIIKGTERQQNKVQIQYKCFIFIRQLCDSWTQKSYSEQPDEGDS